MCVQIRMYDYVGKPEPREMIKPSKLWVKVYGGICHSQSFPSELKHEIITQFIG